MIRIYEAAGAGRLYSYFQFPEKITGDEFLSIYDETMEYLNNHRISPLLGGEDKFLKVELYFEESGVMYETLVLKAFAEQVIPQETSPGELNQIKKLYKSNQEIYTSDNAALARENAIKIQELRDLIEEVLEPYSQQELTIDEDINLIDVYADGILLIRFI